MLPWNFLDYALNSEKVRYGNGQIVIDSKKFRNIVGFSSDSQISTHSLLKRIVSSMQCYSYMGIIIYISTLLKSK